MKVSAIAFAILIYSHIAVGQIIDRTTHILDSIKSEIVNPSDSLKARQEKWKLKVDSLTKIPSENSLSLQDSIIGNRLSGVQENIDSLRSISNKVNSNSTPIELSQAKNRIENVLDSLGIDKNSLEKLNVSSPNVPIDNVNLKLPDHENLFQIESIDSKLPSLNKIPSDKIGIPGDQVLGIKKEVSQYVGEIRKYQAMNLRDVDFDSVAETSLSKVKSIENFSTELQKVEQLKALQQAEISKMNNFQTLRDNKSVSSATAKMLAQEKSIRDQISKMSKYKKKFDNIKDYRYIPKKIKTNSMRHKPIAERIEPGISIQVRKEEKISWYISPEVVYKLSGTFSIGAGGHYWLKYSPKPEMDWSYPMYGYKAIGQVKISRLLMIRAEASRNHVYLPNPLFADKSSSAWKTQYLVGLGKSQKISPRISTTIFGFYNFKNYDQILDKRSFEIRSCFTFRLKNDRRSLIEYTKSKVDKNSFDDENDVQRGDNK
jgi:hypothetical protein